MLIELFAGEPQAKGVEFLDVGAVLTVTPYIGTNDQVLMKVNPEVSNGSINIDTEIRDEQITTVDSTVLLNRSAQPFCSKMSKAW